ncbi:PAS domain S-box protein [uncultured Lutibacter sp.]|uniref:PAS domain S-box protein n=1 Tax=uncultured Lutibacter sp. TaxID=437739 RepID=UPI002618F0C9|nr:PAS domain S-box protein [uncultured Lutibacter sp.]
MNKKNIPDKTSLRKKAEELLKNQVAKNFSQFDETNAEKLIHELEVHKIELEITNVELNEANNLKKELANKYIELYDFAPNGYFSINKDNEIIELNFAAAKMLGRDRSNVKKSQFGFFVLPETRTIFNQFLENVFSSGLKQTCEVVISTNGDAPMYLYLTGIIVANGDYCLVTAIDITEQKKSQEALLKKDKAINASSQVIFITDQEGIITFINPEFTKMYGYEADEIIGKTTPRILKSGAQTDQFYTNFWNTLRNKESIISVEFNNKRKDGSFIEVASTANPILDEQGAIIGFVGMHKDVTERKRAETIQNIILNISNASQKDSDLVEFIGIIQKELGRVIDTSNFFVALYNEETDTFKLPYFKDVQDKMTKFPVGKTMTGLVIKKGVSLLLDKEAVNKLVKNKEVDKIGFDSEIWLGVPLKTKDKIIGALVVQSYTNPTAFAEKDKEVLEIISHQISLSIERKNNEEELNSTKKYLENLINHANAPIIVWNSNFEIQIFNKAFERLTGYVSNKIIGHTLEFLFPLESIIETREKVNHTVLGNFWETIEIPIQCKNGETKIVLWNSANIYDSDEKTLISTIAQGNDITSRKKVELDLIKSKEKAEESDRLKSAFLANMSHEIRTPMNGILGFSDLLKTPHLSDEQQQKYIGVIEKSGKRMLNIINDIVDISKIEAGLMHVEIKESNINEQIEYIYTLFKPEVEAKGMQFFFKNTLPLKEAFIKTDREKVFAIFTNLVKNAIKYTNEGSIEFGYEKKGDYLEFYIKDTGIGIPKDRQEAIFERFIQADIMDKMAREGAGLGLSITKAYIEMLGGKIWVESEEGIGSTFYFTLPYFMKPKEKNSTKDVEVTENTEHQVKNLKTLIAEDDEASEILLSINVSEFSNEIKNARTGTETIEICRNNPDIDLILLDIQMPEMNGLEATRQIRKFNKNVIIIAQTAYGLTGDLEKSLNAGCNDYIAKPINKSELKSLIQKYFNK